MAKTNKQIVTIDDFNVTNLAEFQGKKEQQEQIVIDNPFIEIVDTETFEKAKKHRTTLVSARTNLSTEKKDVAKRIKQIIVDPTNQAYDDLIAITTPHETKQQEEVKRYEAKKEEERLAKQRAEQERINQIQNKIQIIVYCITNEINSLSYEESLNYQIKPMYEGLEVSVDEFQEYGSKFTSEIEALNFTLEQRKSFLAAEEKNRLDAIELQKQRDEQHRVNSIKQAIQNFSNFWNNEITNLTEDKIDDIVNKFNNSSDIDYQEFHQEYLTAKEHLERSLNNRIAQIKQQILLEEQQAEMKLLQRKGILASYGFDFNTLVYVNGDIRYEISEQDIKGSDEKFKQLLNETKSVIDNYINPPQPIKEEVLEVKEEIKNKIPEPTKTKQKVLVEEIKFTPNQVRSIEFIKNFISYAEKNIGTPMDKNVENYVLNTVK